MKRAPKPNTNCIFWRPTKGFFLEVKSYISLVFSNYLLFLICSDFLCCFSYFLEWIFLFKSLNWTCWRACRLRNHPKYTQVLLKKRIKKWLKQINDKCNSPEHRLYTGLSEPEELGVLYNVLQSRPETDRKSNFSRCVQKEQRSKEDTFRRKTEK